MSDRAATVSYRFGVFELTADPPELRRSGRRVKLRPQSLKLLRLLVGHAGVNVSRDAIQQELWAADVFVDVEQGVNHCVKELRAALRDDAETPRYIQTIPRHGYRFIAPVERLAPTVAAATEPADSVPGAMSRQQAVDAQETMAPSIPAAPAASAPLSRAAAARPRASAAFWGWSAVTLLLVLGTLAVIANRDDVTPARASSPPPALAVLPFTVGRQSSPMPYLGVSFADAVISRIARTRTVPVRPISAVVRYETAPAPLTDISRALGVDYVVTGTIEQSGSTQRVDVTVTRARDGAPVWSGAVTGTADALETLESLVAARVVAALNLRTGSAVMTPRAVHPDSYRAYLEGRYRLTRFTADDTLAAVAAFERSLAIDRAYAPAHAGLAIASAQMYIRFGSQADVSTWKSRAERHAADALALDANLAEAHEALAAVARYTEFDWERVVSEGFAATRLNASLDLPHYYVAAALQHAGRFDLVEGEIVAGLEANPWNLAEAYRLRGVTALWSGRFADARTELERVRQLAGRPVSDPHLAAALYYGGDAAAAEAMLDGLKGSAQAEQRAAALLASILAARGDRQRAARLAEGVEAQPYRDHHVLYSLGATYAGLGDRAAAVRWLREAVLQGFPCYPWYQHDPLLKPLHGTPEFNALLEETKAASDRIAARFVAERAR
jgi:DNA-binding winged helix-turn-helix (wHTH) protein/TolB-like protein